MKNVHLIRKKCTFFQIIVINLYCYKIIIDTKDLEQEQINQYKNSIETNQTGIIILKDKIILKNLLPSGEVTYEYKDILGQSGITEFTKQDIIDYARSSDRYTMYSGLLQFHGQWFRHNRPSR